MTCSGDKTPMKGAGGHLYFRVLLAIVAGGVLGYVAPQTAVALKPLGDGFIALGVMHIAKPGKGFNVDPATLDAGAVASHAKAASSQSTVDFILHIIPKTFADAFTDSGNLLQVLFVAILFGYALLQLGQAGKTVHLLIEECSRIFFVMLVLGSVAALAGFNILRFLAYIKEELLTVLGVAMLTSKGAAGVTGSGFITLAATLAVVPSIPVAGLALILGIDRFMSEARALTNFIGNGVAAMVIAAWEKELDRKRMKDALGG